MIEVTVLNESMQVEQIVEKIKTSAFSRTIKSTIEENGNDHRSFYDKYIDGQADKEYEQYFSNYEKFEQIIVGKNFLEDKVKYELGLLMPDANFDVMYKANIRLNTQIIENKYYNLSLSGYNLIPPILNKAIEQNGNDKKAFYEKYIVGKTENEYWYDYENFGKIVDGSRILDDDLAEELRSLFSETFDFDILYLEAYVQNLYENFGYWQELLGGNFSSVGEFLEGVAISEYLTSKEFKNYQIAPIYKNNKKILLDNKNNFNFQIKVNKFLNDLMENE